MGRDRMHFLMYENPVQHNRVDPAYTAEYEAASKAGTVHLFDGASIKAPTITYGKPVTMIYHGWMMTPKEYANLFNIAFGKGYQLINNPTQYFGCHYLDNWYDAIIDLTPRSRIIERSDVIRPMLNTVLEFQKKTHSALIIKDSVKSIKHRWNEACFIPADATPLYVAKVLATFLEIKTQNNDFQGSLVVREYLPLAQIGVHKTTGMPVSHELRAFVLNGKVIGIYKYWNNKEYEYLDTPVPTALFETIAQRISKKVGSKLFTIDLGLLKAGGWTCIEVGDGQVSSLPDNANMEEFFNSLSKA